MVKYGDENTSFFHALATQNHRKIFIVYLCTPDNIIISDHEQKAQHLFESFKDRLGTSDFKGIIFNLSSLLELQDLKGIADAFTPNEIEQTIKSLPNDHASGPNGFNGMFIKKYWQIIKQDFLRLFNEFTIGNLDLTSISNSFIALIPKKDNLASVNDYRPISLLNHTFKCIIKILSTRLQIYMPRLIHENQYGFIKGRTVQDCLAGIPVSTSLSQI